MLEELQMPVVPDESIAQFRDGTRFWIQRVAVPVITVIGMFGNTITIIIMTRRGMRSTTNLYLAALAFCDMFYLVLTFLLGLEHYPNMAAPEYHLYWKLKPYLLMSTDACSNTSVWLTVTFTIERYIAVRYPMKGKVWCTESRAKLLILLVFIVGISFATPVPFEWVVVKKFVIKNNTSNTLTYANNQMVVGAEGAHNEVKDFIWGLDNSEFGKNYTYKTIYYRSTAALFYIIPLILLIYFNGCLIRSVHQSKRERSEMTGGTIRKSKSESGKRSSVSMPKVVVDFSMNVENGKINNNLKISKPFCGKKKGSQDSYQQKQHPSNLQATDHQNAIDHNSSDKVILCERTPLKAKPQACTEANSDTTFCTTQDSLEVLTKTNSKPFDGKSSDKICGEELNELVHQDSSNESMIHHNNSENTSNNSTQSNSAKRFTRNINILNNNSQHYYQNPNQGHGAPHASQERRITIMLISVVILFLCCQLPSAMMILYTATRNLKPNTNEYALVLAFGNIFNFLMAINAAGNFILYSLLSKKYRITFMKLFCNCLKKGRAAGNTHDSRTFSVKFKSVGETSLRSKSSSCQINKLANNKLDTLV